jgi:hypothetical protein
VSAFSGLQVYFHELKLAHLAATKKFNRYTPAGGSELDHLVLDGKSLTNLEIFGMLLWSTVQLGLVPCGTCHL